MPPLRELVDHVLNAAPDVYIRDYVGDSGEPHARAVSASPDISRWPAAVADPGARFGAGSGTEDSNTLGFAAAKGHRNFIDVRVLNQGGSAATDGKAPLSWASVATPVTPDLWTPVGALTVPNVPIGEQLTVSDAIGWPDPQIPAPGHYCLGGPIGNAADPAPLPAGFLDRATDNRFIGEDNHGTWRNLSVEPPAPAPDNPDVPRRYRAPPFLAGGAGGRDTAAQGGGPAHGGATRLQRSVTPARPGGRPRGGSQAQGGAAARLRIGA
jgi:hypothetical protein